MDGASSSYLFHDRWSDRGTEKLGTSRRPPAWRRWELDLSLWVPSPVLWVGSLLGSSCSLWKGCLSPPPAEVGGMLSALFFSAFLSTRPCLGDNSPFLIQVRKSQLSPQPLAGAGVLWGWKVAWDRPIIQPLGPVLTAQLCQSGLDSWGLRGHWPCQSLHPGLSGATPSESVRAECLRPRGVLLPSLCVPTAASVGSWLFPDTRPNRPSSSLLFLLTTTFHLW